MKKSGFFKGFDSMFTDQLFHTDDSGRTYVYPWIGFGTGYLIPDPKKERHVRIAYRTCLLVSFSSIFVLFPDLRALAGNLGLFVGVASLLLVYFLVMYTIVKKLERGHKRSIGQSYRDLARKRGWVALVIATLFCLLLLLLLGWVLVAGLAENIWIVGGAFILMGLVLWVGIYMMYCKLKDK